MEKQKTIRGSLAVAAAYVGWGVLTVFWNLLSEVNSLYILAQRVVWSMAFMGIFMAVSGRGKELAAAFKDRKTLAVCFVCGVLVTLNWGSYIFAVNSGHVLDASLGYFIEPMLVALIGMVIFRERPGRLEQITFLLALAGLIYMMARTGTIPVLALLIAGSFAAYGAVKKTLSLSPCASLFMETFCVTPFALVFAFWMDANGTGGGVLQGMQLLLLPACGIITLLPLLLFNLGVREIPYYISGILMYINPTLQFLMGLVYFHEPLDRDRLIAFCFIWIGILFTVAEHVIQSRAAAVHAGDSASVSVHE